MKKFLQKTVDERQEKELKIIESFAFWVMFWFLSFSIVFQLFILKAHFLQLAGELITLTIGAMIQLVGYSKKGEWGYYSKPCWKSYFLTGTVLALMELVIFSFMIKTENRLIIIVVGAIITFLIGFLLSAVLGHYVNKKREKLEKEYDIDE